MRSCLVVQHVEPEGSYAIGEALDAGGVETVVCRIYAGQPLPPHLAGFDGLVVMGGPMSATSDEGFRTRRQEMGLLGEAVRLGLPTLGVCLGAQLLAAATGGRVMASPAGPEIGWAPVRFVAAAARDPLFSAVPDELTVLHWHGETYDLPPGGTRLASSRSHREQAFRVGARAWGLQFHLEVDEPAVDAFIQAFGQEAMAAGTTPQAIRDETTQALGALRAHRQTVLTRFASLVAG